MPAFAVAPAVLALVFGVAGFSKLGRSDLLIAASARFALPTLFRTRWVAGALPLAEVGLAVTLLVGSGWTFFAAAVAALALSTFFALIVARALARGESFECGCFGPRGDRVSGWSLTRNALLVLTAGAAVAFGSTGFAGVPAAVTRFTESDAYWAIGLILAAGMAALFLHAQPESAAPLTSATAVPLEVGRRVPDVELVTATGDIVRLSELSAMKPQLLLVIRPGCSSCEQLLSSMPETSTLLGPEVGLLVAVDSAKSVLQASHPESVAKALYGVLALREKLQLEQLPAAVLIGLNGRLLAPPALGAAEIELLISQAAAGRLVNRT